MADNNPELFLPKECEIITDNHLLDEVSVVENVEMRNEKSEGHLMNVVSDVEDDTQCSEVSYKKKKKWERKR